FQGDSASTPIASGAPPSVSAQTPFEACQRFGPDPPPGMFRARDPDGTGGYYQPLLVAGGPATTVALERILCNLARAPTDVSLAYRRQYQPNQNPAIADLSARIEGRPIDLYRDDIPPNTRVDFELTLSPDSAETFVLYDPATNTLISAR